MNGFDQQLRTWRTVLGAGAERVGWKIALSLADEQREPALGHLTSATRLPDGGSYDAAGDRELRAEAEVAVVVGEDGGVAGYAAVIELVDVARPPSDLESIVAGNCFHRALVLGETRAEPPEHIRLTVGGERHAPDRALPEGAEVLATAARRLAEAGEALLPGDRVISGSVIHVPVAPGDRIALDMGSLGGLTLAVARPTTPILAR
jgi:2-keto-4-pentenoate hydratase